MSSKPFVAFSLLLLVFMLIAVVMQPAKADTAVVVAACGTPPTTYGAGQNRPTTMDTDGQLCAEVVGTITPSGTQAVNVTQTGGGVLPASGATAAGVPVPMGADNNTTLPTVTNGQRVQLQAGTRGSLNVTLCAANSVNCNPNTTFGDAQSLPTGATAVVAFPVTYNGSTTDRAFACSTFVPISVTAGNTTQVVALSGSTVIRVCNITVSTSLTGSFTIVSGTGSNCATPANSTGAIPVTTATPYTIGDGAAAIYRGSAGGELCITAVTGNITGYAMVAQY